MPKCDWCMLRMHVRRDAKYFAVTGNLRDMLSEEWFICQDHADWLKTHKSASTIMFTVRLPLVVVIDDWIFRKINPRVLEYYATRANDSS